MRRPSKSRIMKTAAAPPTEDLAATLGLPGLPAPLLLTALTHKSRANDENSESNERLEFLGDAVLGLVAGDYLYRQYPGATEGQLTKIRAMVVSAPTLARQAERIGLGEHLRLGRGEAATGGRKRESNLANAFEAIVGALFLNGGLAEAGEFILRHLREEINEAASGRGWPDFKTALQEQLQSRGQKPVYQVTSEAGPDHGKVFTVAVYAGDLLLGQGSGRTKKEAERVAAEQALKGKD